MSALGVRASHDASARMAHPKPTPAQAEAGNYRKGHINFQGIDLTIENAKGSVRRGIGKDGKPWEVRMPCAYGYVRSLRG